MRLRKLMRLSEEAQEIEDALAAAAGLGEDDLLWLGCRTRVTPGKAGPMVRAALEMLLQPSSSVLEVCDVVSGRVESGELRMLDGEPVASWIPVSMAWHFVATLSGIVRPEARSELEEAIRARYPERRAIETLAIWAVPENLRHNPWSDLVPGETYSEIRFVERAMVDGYLEFQEHVAEYVIFTRREVNDVGDETLFFRQQDGTELRIEEADFRDRC